MKLSIIKPGVIKLAGATAVALWLGAGQAQQAALVATDAVIAQTFTQTSPIIGRLLAQQSGAATARIDGRVAAMLVQVGDRVTRGQTLARLDTAALKLRKNLAAARVQTAQAEVALANQSAQRMDELGDSAAVSAAISDAARQRHTIAQAKAHEAEAELALATLDLKHATIAAPFAGAVTARMTEVGDYLRRGDAVARLVSDQQLEVEADLPYDRLGGVAAGAEVVMVLDNGSEHRAVARAIVPQEDPRTRTRRARFTAQFGADAGLLASGQSVTLAIPAGARRDIISVHKDAIIRRGAEALVFVVVDGAAQMRSIRTGESTGDRVEVLDGLRPGDLAVVRGNERLAPNQPVTAAPQ